MDLSNIKIANTSETITTDFLGVTLEVARAKNDKFKRKFTHMTKPYTHQMQTDTLGEDKSAELLAKALAGTVLVGWSGFIINGEEVPFTEENAAALLQNDEDCRSHVIDIASDFSKFLTEAEGDVAKK